VQIFVEYLQFNLQPFSQTVSQLVGSFGFGSSLMMGLGLGLVLFWGSLRALFNWQNIYFMK